MDQHSDTSLQIIDWGLTDYSVGFSMQMDLVQRRIKQEIPNTLVFTEHPATYTLGARKGAEKNLLVNEKSLHERGIQLVKSNRGGDITYHGPGQIVGYVIVDLKTKKDLHSYLRNLEQTLINALQRLGLETTRRENKTGIWVQSRKIAAMGVAVKQWVTYHGFALNVNTDLSPFDDIIPCGIPLTEGQVTSLSRELGAEVPLSAVKKAIETAFREII